MISASAPDSFGTTAIADTGSGDSGCMANTAKLVGGHALKVAVWPKDEYEELESIVQPRVIPGEARSRSRPEELESRASASMEAECGIGARQSGRDLRNLPRLFPVGRPDRPSAGHLNDGDAAGLGRRVVLGHIR